MSASTKLTQDEAQRLVEMLKTALTDEVRFPGKRESVEFDVLGDTKKDLFTIKIYRGKINRLKYELSARIKKDGITLLELHINPGKIHMNPDGTKINGSHWHIYTEEYGRSFAFIAEDINSELFVENTIMFLKKFNVIKRPTVNFQLELI